MEFNNFSMDTADGDLLEENQTATLDSIYMEHHSILHPFHFNLIEKSHGHGQLQNISQPEQQISLPCYERLTFPREQVTYQHNRQSVAEGFHSEKDRNSIKKDFKETVGIVRRPSWDFNRSESLSNTECSIQVPKSQHGKTLHICGLCKIATPSQCHLARHMIIHSGERPYVCRICGRSFARNDNLKVHQRIHTGERPFSCKKCRKSFTRSSDLRTHERTCRY